MRQELEEARRAEQEEKDNIKQQKKADKEAKALKTKKKLTRKQRPLRHVLSFTLFFLPSVSQFQHLPSPTLTSANAHVS